MRMYVDANASPPGRAGGVPLDPPAIFGTHASIPMVYPIHGQRLVSAVESPPRLLSQVLGESMLNALLSGIAPGTRKRYLTAWNQWTYFAHMRGQSEWPVKTQPNWDANLIDFMHFESEMMKNTGGTIASKASSIRLWHVISGLGGFPKTGGRYQQVLRGSRNGHKTARKIPFTHEILHWAHDVFLQQGLGNPSCIELYAATLLGFPPS